MIWQEGRMSLIRRPGNSGVDVKSLWNEIEWRTQDVVFCQEMTGGLEERNYGMEWRNG